MIKPKDEGKARRKREKPAVKEPDKNEVLGGQGEGVLPAEVPVEKVPGDVGSLVDQLADLPGVPAEQAAAANVEAGVVVGQAGEGPVLAEEVLAAASDGRAEEPPAEGPKNPSHAIGEIFGDGKKEGQGPVVRLVMYELDDSTSISSSGYKSVICDNHNRSLAELRALETEDLILVTTETFHGQRINDFVVPREAKDLTVLHYQTIYGTPLNFRVGASVLASEARAQEFRDRGKVCQRIIFFLSDGLDTPQEHEHLIEAEKVCKIVTESIAKGDLIILALGVKNGFVADFSKVFQSLGIPEKWIMVCEGDPVKVARSLDGITRIVSHASSSVENFNETKIGGI